MLDNWTSYFEFALDRLEELRNAGVKSIDYSNLRQTLVKKIREILRNHPRDAEQQKLAKYALAAWTDERFQLAEKTNWQAGKELYWHDIILEGALFQESGERPSRIAGTAFMNMQLELQQSPLMSWNCTISPSC